MEHPDPMFYVGSVCVVAMIIIFVTTFRQEIHRWYEDRTRITLMRGLGTIKAVSSRRGIKIELDDHPERRVLWARAFEAPIVPHQRVECEYALSRFRHRPYLISVKLADS